MENNEDGIIFIIIPTNSNRLNILKFLTNIFRWTLLWFFTRIQILVILLDAYTIGEELIRRSRTAPGSKSLIPWLPISSTGSLG